MPREKLKATKKSFMALSKKDRSLKATVLTVCGFALIVIALFWRGYQIRTLSFADNYPVPASENQPSGVIPTLIKIDKIGLELPIEESRIIDGVWEISYSGASHLDSSANPGEGGNIVVYGHNKNSLFGPIRWLSTGDTIELTDKEGNVFVYEIAQTFETTPDDITHVLPKDEETLTLYTCTGFLDSKRYIIIAKPKFDERS